MNGFSIVSAAATYQISDVNWRVAAIGDFDGDGKSDILWFNKQSGKLAMWFMNGLTYSNAVALPESVDPSWTVVRAGDFNGDGKDDILWRNLGTSQKPGTGENAIWLMNGATLVKGQSIYAVTDLNWTMY
jgi:FG-GAP-like repeat